MQTSEATSAPTTSGLSERPKRTGPEPAGPGAVVETCELSSVLDVHLETRARRLLEVRRPPFTVPWIRAAATPAERTHIAGRGRHARLSSWALGPATRRVA